MPTKRLKEQLLVLKILCSTAVFGCHCMKFGCSQSTPEYGGMSGKVMKSSLLGNNLRGSFAILVIVSSVIRSSVNRNFNCIQLSLQLVEFAREPGSFPYSCSLAPATAGLHQQNEINHPPSSCLSLREMLVP